MILGTIDTIRPVFVNHSRGTLKSGTTVKVIGVETSEISLSGVMLNVLVSLESETYYNLSLDFFHVVSSKNSLALLKRAIRRGRGKEYLKTLLASKKYNL